MVVSALLVLALVFVIAMFALDAWLHGGKTGFKIYLVILAGLLAAIIVGLIVTWIRLL